MVELSTPRKALTLAVGKVSRNNEKIGAPSMTANSEIEFTPFEAARFVKARYECTTGPLLAVIVCVPLQSRLQVV